MGDKQNLISENKNNSGQLMSKNPIMLTLAKESHHDKEMEFFQPTFLSPKHTVQCVCNEKQEVWAIPALKFYAENKKSSFEVWSGGMLGMKEYTIYPEFHVAVDPDKTEHLIQVIYPGFVVVERDREIPVGVVFPQKSVFFAKPNDADIKAKVTKKLYQKFEVTFREHKLVTTLRREFRPFGCELEPREAGYHMWAFPLCPHKPREVNTQIDSKNPEKKALL